MTISIMSVFLIELDVSERGNVPNLGTDGPLTQAQCSAQSTVAVNETILSIYI